MNEINVDCTLGKGKVRSSILRGGTTFPNEINAIPSAPVNADGREMEEHGKNGKPGHGESMGNPHFGAPDGSGKPARLKLYRGSYALTWATPTGSRRVSLGTRDARVAVEAATALYGRFGRDEATDTRSVQHWLTKRLVGARERAKKANVVFTLTAADMQAMYARSGGRCEVSGIPFDLTRGKNGWKQPWRMSLDRKVPALGYTPENCRLVCNAVNAAMGAWGADVLVTIARAIVARHGPSPQDRGRMVRTVRNLP